MTNREKIEHTIFHAAYRIFSISLSEKNDLIELYGVAENKILVVGRPVNPSFLNPAHDETGRPCSLFSDNR